jgi:subtilisin family serine protease
MAQSAFRPGRRGAGLRRGAMVIGVALLAAACDDLAPTASARGSDAGDLLGATGGKLVLVGFRSAPGTAATALIEGLGGRVVHRYRYIPVVAASLTDAQALTLAADPRVAYVEPNLTLHPLGGKQITDWGVSKIDAPGAWALGYRGQGIKVGIFDSGIDIDHPDLAVVGGVDLVGDGNGLDDCQGHGTHVAGIVAGKNNGRYTVGVAPAVELYSMRLADCAWGGGTLDKMIQGLEWAIDNGMDVINMSFGFGIAGVVASPIGPDDPPSTAAQDAFQAAYDRGIVLVAASGNSSTPYISYPAAYPSVIAVGATDDADLIASFSQTGLDQELTAPGVNNLASYLVGKGQETTLTVDSDGDRELEAIPLLFAGQTGRRGITTDAVYAGFGTAVEFAALDCTGKIAVTSRGGPSFAEKAVAAMDAGCAALVIHNVHPGNFNGTLGTATAADGRAWLPVVSISLEEGLYLKEQIEAGPTRATVLNAPGNLAILSGTSMASPHAAGVAALVLSRNPSLTPDQVRAILRGSADDLGTPGWDPVFGYGRINARRAVEQTN